MAEDRRMRVLVLVAVLLAWPGPGARAQDAAAAIRGVISDQIAAFRADDFGAAFEFASPAIRTMFGDPESFGRMVRQGYPMVWRPERFRFSGLEDRDGRKVQGVLVTDQNGALHMLEYEMIPGEGGWRINGVRILQAGDLGA
jgi:hypothetical protein